MASQTPLINGYEYQNIGMSNKVYSGRDEEKISITLFIIGFFIPITWIVCWFMFRKSLNSTTKMFVELSKTFFIALLVSLIFYTLFLLLIWFIVPFVLFLLSGGDN